MNKHTPGPWLCNGYRSPMSGAFTVFNRPFGLSDIAHVYGSEEDARLISAAPDLLAFAKWIVESDPDGQTAMGPIFVKAREAIAKATEGA